MPQKYFSANLRYLGARLRPLLQPAIWAPATILAIAVSYGWDFWQNARWSFSDRNQRSPLDSFLSSDDQAAGADLDNLQVLLNDFGLRDSTSQRNNQRRNNASGIPGARQGGVQATPPLNFQANPLLAQNSLQQGAIGSNLLPAGGLLSGNPLVANAPGTTTTTSVNFLTGGVQTTPSLPANVLQQSLNATLMGNSSSSTPGTNSNAPTVAQTGLSSGLRQPLPSTLSFPTLPTVPGQTTPTTSSTGFPTLPTAPPATPPGTSAAVPLNSYTGLTGAASPGAAPTAVPGSPVPSAVNSSSPVQSPFSQPTLGGTQFGSTPPAPAASPVSPFGPPPGQQAQPGRFAPGRYLGGGQINTFSNPLGTSGN